jgi:hypothetical protein
VSYCVFVGPTLRSEEVAAVCDAVCLPPVAQGDIYRAAQRRPRAIGIIDGYFSGAPSVWHKEILWAISHGVPVFGSASMGALRAAELHSFGMRGVGRIFEAYRDGMLEDDDEVAVVHGPAEAGFVAVSEPMVNIRATLVSAESAGILSTTLRLSLEAIAKALFFAQRNWHAILDGASALGLPEPELAALHLWLPNGRIDQKRQDALAMLSAMCETPNKPELPSADFYFEWTHFWDEFVARNPGEPAENQLVIEELRLEGEGVYEQAKRRALLRLLAKHDTERRELVVSPEDKRATLARLRAAHQLFTRRALDTWLVANDLETDSFERLIEDEAQLETLARALDSSLEQALLDELRLSGHFERLAKRAAEKKDALTQIASHVTWDYETGPSTIALRLWFFEQHLSRQMPDNVEDFARALGFSTVVDFDSALQREWLYLQFQRRRNAVT